MFAMTGINEHDLLMGRPHGGCAILKKTTFGFNSKFVESQNSRVCSVLHYANLSNVRDDVDNHSDHPPITLYMCISLFL